MMDTADLVKFLLEDEELLLLEDGKVPDIPWFSSDLMCFSSVDPFPHTKRQSRISHDAWEELNKGLDELILRPERKGRNQRKKREPLSAGPDARLANSDNSESQKRASRGKKKEAKEHNEKPQKMNYANGSSKAIRAGSKVSPAAKFKNCRNDKDKKESSQRKNSIPEPLKRPDSSDKSTHRRPKEDNTKQNGEKLESTHKDSTKKRKPKKPKKKKTDDMKNST